MKREARRLALAARAAVKERTEYSRVITDRLTALPEYKCAKRILCYASYNSEVDTSELCRRIIAEGKELHLPRCDVETKSMTACKVTDLSALKKGAYGIPEPEGEGILPQKLDLVVVPMVAFDKNKGRIGYGAGYYDRFLPMTNAFRCGIAFSAQEVECASFEETDLPMDLIITEREMIV